MIWKRLKSLWPAWRREQEREMREELGSLLAIAGSKELGNLTLAMEDVRATWGWTWLESIFADIRYSLRALRKQPAFAAVAVLSLALAIGANSAIFSLADALLLRPLPAKNPATLFDVITTAPDNPFEGMSFSDYRDDRLLEPIAVYSSKRSPTELSDGLSLHQSRIREARAGCHVLSHRPGRRIAGRSCTLADACRASRGLLRGKIRIYARGCQTYPRST